MPGQRAYGGDSLCSKLRQRHYRSYLVLMGCSGGSFMVE